MMKRKLAVLTLALSAAMMLSFGAFAEEATTEAEATVEAAANEGHSNDDGTVVSHDPKACYDESQKVVIKEATCTEDGIYRYPCKYAAGQWHEEIIPATGHAWASVVNPDAPWGEITVAPTCGSEGQAIDYCLNCGITRDVYRTIAPIKHNFVVKVVDVEANCDHAGKWHYECDMCGTPETYTEGENKGKIKYTEIPLIDNYHDINNTWDEWVVEKAPTCATEGVKVRWCKICGDKEYGTVAKLDHKWELVGDKVLDCYHRKLTYRCMLDGTKEGHTRTERTEIKAHVFDYTKEPYEVKKPTCEEDGYRIYRCVYYDTTAGHEGDKDAEVKIVDLATGHNWSAWVQRYAANEQGNKYGYWVRTCKTCKKTEEYVGENPPEDYGKNGWVNEDGKISYYKQDVLQKDMTGVYAYNNGMFFVTEGTIDGGANGLNLNNGTWYFLANGQIQTGYDGFAEYDNNWFMIDNGVLDENANGLYAYNGGTFMFAAGKLRTDVSGLWQDPSDGSWYYLSNGQVATNHTGVVEYDGAFFYVVNGKLASGMNGTVDYDGSTFKVVAGQLY